MKLRGPFSLKRRLQMMITFTAVFVTLIMGLLWIVNDHNLHKTTFEKHLTLQASLLATIIRPAMSFQDGVIADEILAAFQYDSEITQIALFNDDGVLFKHVQVGASQLPAPVVRLAGLYHDSERLQVYHTIEMKGHQLGMVMVESDLHELHARLQAGIIMVVLAMLLSLLMAYILSFRLHSQVSRPMKRIVQLMRQLAFDHNYSLRMKGMEQFEEISSLQAGFNAMAEEIEHSFKFIEDQKNDLIEQEERFRLLVETIPLPVAVTRKEDGKVLFVNNEGLSFFQMQHQPVESLSSLMVISQESRDSVLSEMAQHGFVHDYEIEVHKFDGSNITMLLSSQFIDFAGEEALLNVMVDVTERNLMQQQLADHNLLLEEEVVSRTDELMLAKNEAEKANRDKSRFLASASHDLRQPLQALTLFLASLEHTLTTDEQKGLLSHAQQSKQGLSDLLSALLDVSRLSSGSIHVEKEVIQLSTVLKALALEWQPIAQNKGLDFRLRSCDEIYIKTDEVYLSRLLRNLLSNAVRYTEQGGILLGCRRFGDAVRICVWDTGSGLEQAQLQAVFDEFYQVGNPERDREKGVGLGLSIVKGLSEALDHPLYLRSAPGAGSCFAVDVPLVVKKLQRERAELSASSTNLSDQLILVIDDDKQLRNAMGITLRQHGCQSMLAESGEDALLVLKESGQRPDCIIADYRLREGKTGLMAVEQIRKTLADDIPAIIVTGDTDELVKHEVKAADCVLAYKPVNINRLLFIMESIQQQE